MEIQVCNGWASVAQAACLLSSLDGVVPTRVKNKLGRLTFMPPGIVEKSTYLMDAVKICEKTCEFCGSVGAREDIGGIMCVICDDCKKAIK